jgi:hypothetical protein
MKLHLFKRQNGAVLFMTLVIALLVGIVVSALLLVSQQQNYLTARSKTWSSEIPIAEAGIEEAMAHLNSRPTLLGTNGWAFSGTNLVKQGTFEDGYYYATMYTSLPPTIVSIGFGRIPLQTNFTRRTVMVTTKMTPPTAGIVAKGGIVMNGSTAYVDSFDSSDPANVGGAYNAARRRDRAVVATLLSTATAIDTGNAKIYGYAQTGPGGSAAGTVGDGGWCATTTGIQPGHFRDDFNMAITDVTLPTGLDAKLPPLAGVGPDLLPYTYVLGNDDYAVLTSLSLGNTTTMIVTGRAKLYVAGTMKLTAGSLVITTNGSLDLYLASDSSFAGNGIINGTGIASRLSVYGLPTCKNFTYTGSEKTIARIYAPEADIVYQGTMDFAGSIVCNSLKITGTPALHYDEALNAPTEYYRVVSWEEL